MKISKSFIILAALVLTITACKKSAPQWHINGTIADAGGQTMYVEASENGNWYLLDSVTLADNGSFKFSSPAAGFPDIYRLRLGEKSLYFPIDSIETVTVTTKASAFDTEYTLSGSEQAEKLMAIDKKLRDAVAKSGAINTVKDSILKRELAGILIDNPSGIVSYYIINRSIGGQPLFDPADSHDLKIIGAVANAFYNSRPTDPRTNYLKTLYLSRKRTSVTPDTLIAHESTLIDVNLFNRKGVKQSLSAIAKQSPVVLLNFTSYAEDYSPAFNIELNKIYSKYHSAGLEIYQVGFDSNEVNWRETAANLPWITVYNSPTDGLSTLTSYNVGALPALFIIKNGEIRERVADATAIDKAVAKYM